MCLCCDQLITYFCSSFNYYDLIESSEDYSNEQMLGIWDETQSGNNKQSTRTN